MLGDSGAVAGQVEFQDHRVVDHPVNGGCRSHGVREDVLPLGEDQVGGDAQGATFVSLCDEGEERLRLLGALGQVAQVIQEQEVEVVQLARSTWQGHALLGSHPVLHQPLSRAFRCRLLPHHRRQSDLGFERRAMLAPSFPTPSLQLPLLLV